MVFPNPFDQLMFEQGPPAVFLPDRKGEWKLEPTWSRDAWGRDAGPHERGVAWALVRDKGTGFITLVVLTSPTLLRQWPRADVRLYEDEASAREARAAFGEPPLCREAWV